MFKWTFVRLNRALPVDHTFFSRAAHYGEWDEASAWIYGWILSDGCVTDNKRIQLHLHTRDIDVLRKMATHLRSEHKISSSESGMSQFGFRSQTMANDLEILGITPRKTKTVYVHETFFFPENARVVGHALRGIIEGDGSIGCYCKKKYLKPQWRLSLAGNGQVLAAVQSIIHSQKIIAANGCLHFHSSNNCWKLSYSGNRSVPSLCNWLYADASENCRLNRKAALAFAAMRLHHSPT